METILNKRTNFRLNAKSREMIMDIAVYLFIVLFMYTAASKLFTINLFASTLAKSPLIGNLNLIVAWAIPLTEIAISMVLIFPRSRQTGMRAALLLMTLFTVYLSYMILAGSKLPCHCGGVISTMSWQQHIWFNIGFIVLAITSLISQKK